MGLTQELMDPEGTALPVRHLTNAEKAAVIVRLLISEGAAPRLTGLSPRQQERLVERMASLAPVDRRTLAAVAQEFAQRLDNLGLTFPGNMAGALEMNNLLVRGGEVVVIPRLACLANHDSTPSCEIWLGDQRQVDVVAVRDLKAGDEITLDYCACSATVDHRRMVLGPFGLAHLAAVELVEDVEEEFPDHIPENRRRVDPPPQPPGPGGE